MPDTATTGGPRIAPEIVDRLEEILKADWGQGTYGLFGGCCCLAGACGRIYGAQESYSADDAAVALGLPEIILRLFPERAEAWLHPFTVIPNFDATRMAGVVLAFNDHSQTQLADVLKVVNELRS